MGKCISAGCEEPATHVVMSTRYEFFTRTAHPVGDVPFEGRGPRPLAAYFCAACADRSIKRWVLLLHPSEPEGVPVEMVPGVGQGQGPG